ncbi:MAG TPA: choice-of-anchor Q domain-containing protein [Puia sp.]|nr:choice-of-anchor Q domain-containing protein [Puia sp.]
MKFFYSFMFLLVFQDAFPNILYIGTGSGAVVKKDMAALRSGDTLAIRSGSYERGGSFSNLRNITIINYGGVVDFGQSVDIGNLAAVTISGAGMRGLQYGIRFQQMKCNAFFVEAPCNHLSLAWCEYRNLDGNVLDASHFFTSYNGDTATMALYKTTISHQKLVHSGPLFVGSWASTTSFQNVVDSIAFLHVIVDSTNSDVCQVLGQSIYRMLASDWRITGPCANGKHDAGIFQMTGNGTLRNIYRHGGFGYLWRIWNVGLNGRANSYMYNCIDLSSDAYGTIDTRISAADTSTGNNIPFCRGGNMHVLNNTSGNKRNATHYVSVLVVAGQFFSKSGYSLEVRNNLSFNNITDNANPLVKQNTGDPLTDTSNNIYAKDPIQSGILSDTVDCRLNLSGPAIDRALPEPFIKTDIEGIPRPSGEAADIGAREFPGSGTRHPGHAYFPKKYLFIGAGLIALTALILAQKKPVHPKNGNPPVNTRNQPFREG